MTDTDTDTDEGAEKTRTRTRTRAGGMRRTAKSEDTAQASGGKGAGDNTWMHRGDDARRVGEREMKRQSERSGNRAFRFWLKPGTEADVVILDVEPPPCFWEHNLQDPQNSMKRTLWEGCPKEWSTCPLCSKKDVGDSYYVMMLTIIDCRGFTSKKTGKKYEYQKRILPIKAGQHQVFDKLRQINGNGDYRGMHLLMSRSTEKTSFAIGVPTFVAVLSEDTLLAEFGNEELRSSTDDTRVLKRANEDTEPFDYNKMFEKPDAADLRDKYGGAAPAGNAQESQEVADAWEGDQSNEDTDAKTTEAPSGGGMRRRAQEEAIAGEEIDDEIPF